MGNSEIQSQNIRMSDALRGTWRRKKLVLTTLVLGVLAGASVLYSVKPAYQSEAQILIENLVTPYEKVNTGQDARQDPVSDRVVTSQVTVIKSQDLAARVAEKLKLQDNKKFNPLPRSHSTLKQLMIATGFADDPALMTPEQTIIKQLIGQTTVYPIPESNAIGIKYVSSDGKIAADVANALAETYIASTRETEAGSTNRAREWLGQQITYLRAKVSKSESDVEKYRSEAGLLKGGSTSTLSQQQISELNTQISVAEAASAEATARANEIKSLLASKGSVDASSDVLSSPVIQNLREKQTTSAGKLSELSATYLPNHPKMIAARQELDSINAQVRREALKVVDSLIGQAKVAAARASSLRSSLEKLKASESALNLDDVKLKELERNALADRTFLETMLARYADANARQDLSLQPGFARIIQKAAVQTIPYFPKPGPIMLLTTMTGLGLGLGLAFLMEVMQAATRPNQAPVEHYRSHPARTALNEGRVIPPFAEMPGQIAQANMVSDMAAKVDRPIMYTIEIPTAPTLAHALSYTEAATGGDAQSTLAMAGEVLFKSCKSLIEAKGLKSLALMSIGGNAHDAGLATISAARNFANHKVKVVVVDVTSSSFETLAGLQQGHGLSDLVMGEADFTKVICRDPFSPVHIVRFGLKSKAESQATLVEKFGSILNALTSIYDVVLVHAGEASPTTPALTQHCKAALIIAPQSRQADAINTAKVLQLRGVTSILFARLEDAAQYAKTA